MITRRKKLLIVLGCGWLFVIAALAWDNHPVMAAGKEEYRFDHEYVKPGDTLKVLHNGKELTQGIQWTVKTISDGAASDAVVYKTLLQKEASSLQITNSYLESFIEAQAGGETLRIYCSRLPVMCIDSETPYYAVEKEKYTQEETTHIQLKGNDTYSQKDYWYDGTGQIKLRGNSTAYRPKRPFKLKLSSKADLLGLGAEKEESGKSVSYPSKHWVLLANDIDHSLMRNKLLYDFSGEIGTEFYFHSTNVILIYNGQYEGVYQLCEHRRVDPGRIDITDWTAIGEEAADKIASAVAEKNGWDKEKKKSFTKEMEKTMCSDYSWMDKKQVTYHGTMMADTVFSFADYGITLPKADGGFLMEMDFYSIGNPAVASITTNYQQPLYFSAPEPGEDAESQQEKVRIVNSFKTTGLYNYAKKYTQTFEYALHSDDFVFRNADQKFRAGNTRFDWWNSTWDATYEEVTYQDADHEGKHYSELFDMDSLVTNFLFCEYAMNWDSMKNSFFYYKKVGEPAKIGPQWDFDWCWGNTNMYNIFTSYPTRWHTTIDEFVREQYYQTVQWNRMLVRDPYFLTLAYEKYHAIRPVIENMIKNGGLLDQYESYLAEAGAANDVRWSYTYGTEYSGARAQNFAGSVKTIRDFLQKRVSWLDKQFDSVDTLVKSLGYYQSSDDILVSVGIRGDMVGFAAGVSNSEADKIVFQINGTIYQSAEISDGVATVWINKKELREKGLNVVVANEMDKKGNYLPLRRASKTGKYNVVKSDYEVFSVQDLKSLQPQLPKTEEKKKPTLRLNVKSLKMQKGTSCTGLKADKMIKNDYVTSFRSSNSKVVKVNQKGKLTAVKKGKAVITVKTFFGAKATVKITVGKKKIKTKKITVKKKLTLKKGQTYQLKLSRKPISASETVLYKSSNKKLVSVSKKGKIRAKKKGTAIITVKSGKATGTVTVKVS